MEGGILSIDKNGCFVIDGSKVEEYTISTRPVQWYLERSLIPAVYASVWTLARYTCSTLSEVFPDYHQDTYLIVHFLDKRALEPDLQVSRQMAGSQYHLRQRSDTAKHHLGSSSTYVASEAVGVLAMDWCRPSLSMECRA